MASTDRTYADFYKSFLGPPVKTGKNTIFTCPFCEANKYSVDIKNGLAKCLNGACVVKHNITSFMTDFHATWFEYTPDEKYQELSEARGISVETLRDVACLAYNEYADKWLVPYVNPYTENLITLGNFSTKGKTAFRIYKPPKISDDQFIPFYFPMAHKERLAGKSPESIGIVLEGEWDNWAMCDLQASQSRTDALFAVPGASNWPEKCYKWFGEIETLIFLYDYDTAGAMGVDTATVKASSWADKLFVVDWSTVDGAEEDCDVRDMLTWYPEQKAETYAEFINALSPIERPQSDDGETLSEGYIASIIDIPLVDTFNNYISAYADTGMQLSQSNVDAIAVCNAIGHSQYLSAVQREPLWFFLQAPAGGGKTTHIESYGGRNELYDYISRITPKSLISGFMGGGEETSTIASWNGRTVFIKDFTVVLDMTKIEQREVFSLMRDIYDGTISYQWGNGKKLNLHNLCFNVIAGVTDAILAHNDASMGERFLRVDYAGNDVDTHAIVQTALKNFGQKRGGKQDRTNATVGYIKTLILPENRWDIDNFPVLSDYSVKHLDALAHYTAFSRTRAERNRKDEIIYKPRKEVAVRLGFQFAKLGFALEKVWNPKCKGNGSQSYDFSDRTLNVIRQVAFGTAAGFQQDIVHQLLNSKSGVVDRSTIANNLKIKSTQMQRFIDDMKRTDLIITHNRTGQRRQGRPLQHIELSPEFKNVAQLACKGETIETSAIARKGNRRRR